MVSDDFLIKEIKEDNRMAFTIIYDKFHTELYSFAYKYLRDTASAEDVVQHTFLKLWEIRKKLNPSLNLKGYLYNIAKNHALNLIRNYNIRSVKNAQYSDSLDQYEESSPYEAPGTDMISILNKAINSLSPQRTTICRMKITEGLSNEEIAQRLGISVSTVKNQYSTSLKQIRLIMGLSMAGTIFINIIPPI